MNSVIVDSETLTGDDIVHRATDLIPLVIEQAAETEARGFYSEDLHRRFVDAGLYRLTIPKEYGGLELGLDVFCKTVIELARGDGATGWCYALGAGKAIAVAGYWPEEAQRELLSSEAFFCPGTWGREGRARRVDGGWRVTGTYRYCSGSAWGTHFWGNALTDDVLDADGEPINISFIAPRSEWERLDDWGWTLGMRGSGSHSVRFEDGFVPDHLVMIDRDFMTFSPSDSIGAALHNNPMYRGRPASWFSVELGAIAVGLAKAALDLFSDLMTRKIPHPPFHSRAEDVDYQLWYGEAVGKVRAAEEVFLGAVRHIQEKSESGDFDVHDDLLAIRLCRETVNMAWDTIHRYIVRTSGSQLRDGSRFERIFRDAAQLMGHGYTLEGQTASRDLARDAFGVAPKPGDRSLLPPT